MDVSKLNATPSFGCNECGDKKNEPTVSLDTKPDEFTKTKKDASDVIDSGVKVATAGSIAVPTGLLAGEKVANGVEDVVVKFTNDFADDAVKAAREECAKGLPEKGFKQFVNKIKNFSTEALTELPKTKKSAIKWGVAGVVFLAITYLLSRDKDADGKCDIIEALKKFANPG